MVDHTRETETVATAPRPESWLLTPATVVAVLVGLVLALAMAGGMFWIGNRYAKESAELPDANKPTLRELEVVDERELTSYGWIDRQRGIVRMPIESAMELLAKEGESEAEKPRTAPAG